MFSQLTEKAGFLLREYVKCSLYDRMSTRPFLTSIEKRWVAFQILYALHQCHKVGVSGIFILHRKQSFFMQFKNFIYLFSEHCIIFFRYAMGT